MRIGSYLIFGVTGLILVGCSGGKDSGGGFSGRKIEGKTGVFRYAIPTSPTSLDPVIVQDGDTIDIIQQEFEGLVKWGTDNRVQPNLAEKWDISPDGTTYTFHLKKGVKFTNGRVMTAEDFKWCMERACNPKKNSPTAGTYMADIVGVKERLNDKSGKVTEVSGIKVIDPNTLEIKIDKARPYFLDKLTYASSFVYAKEALPDPMKDMAKPEEMVGTGPFKLTKFVPDSIVVLSANMDYHDGAPKLSEIQRPVVMDASTRLSKYKTGELDLITLELQDLKSIKDDPKLSADIQYFERPSMYYLGMNCDVIKDRRVRQAIGMALDRDKIVKDVLGGINRRADSILPPSVKCFREKTNYLPFDIAKAKALMAEAGYPDGKGFPELEFNFRDGRPDVEIVASAIQQQLKQNLGINLKGQKMAWLAYLDKHNSHKMQTFHMRWAADYLDPENFLSTLLASYGNENKINYKNDAYDALCREGDMTMDENKRKELYAKAEDMVLQDAPFIPIYFQRDVELISKKVVGIRNSAFGHLPHTTTAIQ